PWFSPATAAPQLSTLSLHDALPISRRLAPPRVATPRATSLAATLPPSQCPCPWTAGSAPRWPRRLRSTPFQASVASSTPSSNPRSEEHTSELQSREKLVCRLLLDKK